MAVRLSIAMIIDLVDKFNESIADVLRSKKISNTGEAIKSLEVQFGNDFVRSLGIFYLEFLDTGRGPSKKPKSPPFEEILTWVIQKTGKTKAEAVPFAWYVVKRIAEVGTLIFQDNKKGIELTDKVRLLRRTIIENVGETAKAEVIQKLDKYKNIFKSKKLTF